MTFNVVLAVLVILSIQFVYSVEQDAYSLLFTDSKDVFLNKPIHFQYPLQKWLNGSLVRSFIFRFEQTSEFTFLSRVFCTCMNQSSHSGYTQSIEHELL